MQTRKVRWGDLVTFRLHLLGGVISLLLAIPVMADEPVKKITAVVYSQADCPPCLRMKKVFSGTKLPVSFEDRPAELARQRIKATPTTIIFRDGWPVYRQAGSLTPQAMKDIIDHYQK